MKNFYLKLEGQMVDVAPGMSVTLERYNAFFDFDTLNGSKVMDFSIPFTPLTDKLFSWYGLQQTRYDNKKLYCEKYAEGQIVEKGWVQLNDVNDSGYQIFFSQSLGDFFNDYQDTPLNIIDFGTIPINLQVDFNYQTDAVAWPMIKNTAFYGVNIKEGFNGFINEVVDGSFTDGSPKVPFIGYRFLFDKIAELCKVKFTGDFFDTNWFRAGLIDNTFCLDELTEIKIQNHLPETLTIPTFLKELGKLLNIGIYINTIKREVKMQMREQIMREPTTIDLTTKVVPSRSRKPETAKRLELNWELDSNDALMKVVPDDFMKYQSEGSDGVFFPINTKISTRIVENGMAKAEQIGISTLFSQGANKFTAKMLLWNGVINGIPIATNELGDLRLAWHGDKNLIKSNFKRLDAWRKNTSSRVVFARLNANDLAMLDWQQNGGINTAVHIHGRDYYIANIRINLPIEGYATLELWEK